MVNNMTSAAVVGASGYSGAELVRLLLSHPAIDLAVVTGGSAAGKDLADVFPHLAQSLELAESTPEAVAEADLVFLATPHEVSADLAPALLGNGQRVVDLSGAFRLTAGDFEQWYGMAHPVPELAPAVYGLPELFDADIAGARLVANPGCYPTAALLALGGLRDLVEPGSVHIAGLSGTSGAGKSLRDELQLTHAAANVAAYGAPRHRHTPEIEQAWARLTGVNATLTFVPHLLPMPRGLLATVTATLHDGAGAEEVAAAVTKTYDAQPFVRVLPPGAWPSTTHLRGGNGAVLGVAVDDRTGRVTASCAIDNLGKGAAGQAVQNANLMLGLDPTTGLTAAGIYP